MLESRCIKMSRYLCTDRYPFMYVCISSVYAVRTYCYACAGMHACLYAYIWLYLCMSHMHRYRFVCSDTTYGYVCTQWCLIH